LSVHSGWKKIAGRCLSWERPALYWDVVGIHGPGALITGLFLLAAWLAPFDRLPLKFCWFSTLTGYSCPFCGYSRAFADMAAGRWWSALHTCPGGVWLFLATLLVFAWNAAGLVFGVRLIRGPWLRLGRHGGRWLIGLLVLVVLANWI